MRVLDAKGRELAVGDQVHDVIRFRGQPDLWAAVTEIKWDYGWRVWLRGPADPRAAEDFEVFVVPDEQPDTYICPDLQLVQPTEEAAVAAPEGSNDGDGS